MTNRKPSLVDVYPTQLLLLVVLPVFSTLDRGVNSKLNTVHIWAGFN